MTDPEPLQPSAYTNGLRTREEVMGEGYVAHALAPHLGQRIG
ncbi:hypothetical protein DFR71_6330 [Nocardia alba]|uniref:Uncharacterized protein n=1 Tax=Nocardia alba TaxID=225051 RepID=A0A4R1F6U3_9NOCA|nr:hypothetical protein DFR71_6330 [Nocardia alba]